jgi:hypothetical protein
VALPPLSVKMLVIGRSRPAVDHRVVSEGGVDIGFAASEAETLVETARPEIVNRGPQPDCSRHLPLGQVQQSSSYSPTLGGRGDEDLVELTDIGLSARKPTSRFPASMARNTFHPEANSTAGIRVKNPSLLAGLLFDNNGRRMTPTHAVKNGRHYLYWLCHGDGVRSRESARSNPVFMRRQPRLATGRLLRL